MDEQEMNAQIAKLTARLVVECGIYKRALEEILYSETPDQFASQVALYALDHARQYLESQGVNISG